MKDRRFRIPRDNRTEGFTLLECITVIGIIAILATILFPVFAKAREKARTVSCASNLMQMGLALHMYAQDHAGRFPPRDNEIGDVMSYVKNTWVYVCPSKIARDPWEDSGRLIVTGYCYRGGFTNDSTGTTRLMFDAEADERAYALDTRHNDGVNVLFLSGRVKWVSGAEWYQRKWPVSEGVDGQ